MMNRHDRLVDGLFYRLGRAASRPESYRKFIISALTEILSHGPVPNAPPDKSKMTEEKPQ